MLLDLRLPTIIPAMTTALIEVVYATTGCELKPGDKILDLTIHLGPAFAQDCPPITHYRLVARERAFVRELLIARGQPCAPGDRIALLATSEGDPPESAVGRPLRITVVGILRHAAMASSGQIG
jgi:hypothetical protein